MMRHTWLALVLTASLAGCAQAPGLSATRTPVTSLAAAEATPSVAELARLEAASPDRLISQAPGEPGLGDRGIWPHPPAEDLGNFGEVTPTLWRGARPTDKGLAQLVDKGVKTIVTFENDKDAVAHEQAWAEAHGLEFHAIPLSVITPPKLAKVNEFLALATAPTKRPLYFHCMQGRDRTGTAAYCYRLSQEKWTREKAYAEMKQYHFHTYLLGLQGFLLWYAHGVPSLELAAQ